MSLDHDEIDGLTEDDMGELRNLWSWEKVPEEELQKLRDLAPNRALGIIAADRYLYGEGQLGVVTIKPPIIIPIIIMASLLIVLGVLGIVFGR